MAPQSVGSDVPFFMPSPTHTANATANRGSGFLNGEG